MKRTLLLAAIGAFSTIGAPATAVNIAWLPVTDAERQMSAPIVEKNAGVEAIFWRVHVMDEFQGQDLQRVLYHYVRLKIFNQDGKEKVATIDLRYGDKTNISAISGRTIKADGSIVELTRDAVHDRVLTRMGGLKQRVKSFDCGIPLEGIAGRSKVAVSSSPIPARVSSAKSHVLREADSAR